MSYLSDSRQPRGPGVLILRHNDHEKQGYSVDMRAGLLGVGISGRQTEKDQLGHYEYEGKNLGDITQALLWPADIQQRAVGGWAWAWPAMSSPSQSVDGTRTLNAHPNDGISITSQIRAPNGPTTANGKCRMSRMDDGGQDSNTVLPVWINPENGKPIPDKRFTALKPITIGDAPKNPKGSPGIVLAATNEDKQYELFFPIGNNGKLFAVNQGGDWEMGTILADTTPDWEPDPEKTARLQSLMWVVKKASLIVPFSDRNFIAWNIGTSGCGDHQGGAVIQAGPITCAPLDASVALVNASHGGPFDVGAGMADKHFLGQTDPGVSELRHPVTPLHFSTATLWRDPSAKSDGKGKESKDPDGPFDFEGPFEGETESGDYNTVCHLHWWPDAEHESPGGKRKGKWKWFAEAQHSKDTDEEPEPVPEPTPDGGDGGGPVQHEGPPDDNGEEGSPYVPQESKGADDPEIPADTEEGVMREFAESADENGGTPPPADQAQAIAGTESPSAGGDADSPNTPESKPPGWTGAPDYVSPEHGGPTPPSETPPPAPAATDSVKMVKRIHPSVEIDPATGDVVVTSGNTSGSIVATMRVDPYTARVRGFIPYP